MSSFAVTVEKVEKLYPHDNADSLELARLEGLDYQFVVPKGKHYEGELVVYFPLDSLIPEPVLDMVGLTGRLSGKQKNRVKTVRLRGHLSEGVLASLEELQIEDAYVCTVGMDFTEWFGVEKYEPPVRLDKNARTRSLPSEIRCYDIENAQRYPDVVKGLMDIPCLVTEKLEGSNYAAMLRDGGSFVVCTHRQQVEEIEGSEHTWWKVTRNQDIPQLCQMILDSYGGHARNVIVRGEVCGPKIQGNIYKLKDHRLFIFDIEVDSQPLDAQRFLELADGLEFETVPILESGITLGKWLDSSFLQEASVGCSLLREEVQREGIIFRPMTEQRDEKLGRVILKQKSPEYLLGSNA